MKKFVLVLGLVMALSLVSVASAATLEELQAQVTALMAQISALQGGTTAVSSSVPTITKSLTIGSRGDEVAALQMYLEDEGYLEMPIGVDYGYFGTLTKAAVAEWQKANDVSPAAGYFGPISRAALEALAAAAPATPATESLCPNGMTLASNCTVAPAVPGGTTPVVGLDNTDGSISATRDNYAGDQSMKKGDTKDIYAVKLQATAGKVAVTRFDVRMNARPHLYFTKLTLKDSSNGAVIAEKSISSSADVTELSSGSDYLVRFDNLNYVVEPNNNKVLVVSATVSANTDKIPDTGATVKVMVGPSGIRTLNGKGYTDALSIGNSNFTGDIRTITLASTGSNGNIVARLNSGSPLARTQAISTSGETEAVVLGIFDLKAENQNSKVENLTISLGTDGADPSDFIKRLKLSDGSRTYTADSVAASSTFSSLDIQISKDQWKTLTVTADIADADDITGVASTTATINVYNGSNPTGIDTNDSSLTATANTVSASKVTFSVNSLTASNMSVTAGQGIVGVANGPVVKYPVQYSFTLTNNGDTNLYVSKTAGVFVGTTTAPTADNASSTLTEIQPIAAVSGDTDAAYVIPSNGGNRTFTLNGTIGQAAGVSSASLRIGTIYYGTTAAAPTTATITNGLEPLYRSFVF